MIGRGGGCWGDDVTSRREVLVEARKWVRGKELITTRWRSQRFVCQTTLYRLTVAVSQINKALLKEQSSHSMCVCVCVQEILLKGGELKKVRVQKNESKGMWKAAAVGKQAACPQRRRTRM